MKDLFRISIFDFFAEHRLWVFEQKGVLEISSVIEKSKYSKLDCFQFKKVQNLPKFSNLPRSSSSNFTGFHDFESINTVQWLNFNRDESLWISRSDSFVGNVFELNHLNTKTLIFVKLFDNNEFQEPIWHISHQKECQPALLF